MGIRDYLTDPSGRRHISQAIRGAFERKRGVSGRVLVVDTDPLSRETLIRMLKRANYLADGVADEREAVAQPNLHEFDLLIKEKRQPYEEAVLVDALRERSPTLKILTVASASNDVRLPRSRKTASHTLVRPFDTRQLLRAVKRAMQQNV